MVGGTKLPAGHLPKAVSRCCQLVFPGCRFARILSAVENQNSLAIHARPVKSSSC